MKKNQIRTDRLRKLANHLLHGKLGHKKFSFGLLNSGITGHSIVNECGACGCAIGELPILHPKAWEFSDTVKLKRNSSGHTFGDAKEWFNLTDDMTLGLFYPNQQKLIDFPLLDIYATKEEVANNILLFCDKVDEIK